MEDYDTLTSNERHYVRSYLTSFMAAHPARVPFHIRALDWTEAALWGSSTDGVFSHGRLAGAALLVVLFTGVGTSYAAENALPGQALYGVKVNINEKIAGAMAATPVARAQFDAELTARRLEEAEVLAAANQLSPEVSSEIQTRLNETTESFNGHIAALAESEEGTTVVEDVQSDLEAKLSAHANVLAALGATVPESKAALAPILSTVENHVATARKARKEVTVALTVGTLHDTAPVRAAAAAKKKENAQEALGRVRTLATEVAASSGASSSASISQGALEVQVGVLQGEEYLENGDYDKAVNEFQNAIRAATETQTQATVSLELQKILPSLPMEATTTVQTNIDPATGEVLGTSTIETSDED